MKFNNSIKWKLKMPSAHMRNFLLILSIPVLLALAIASDIRITGYINPNNKANGIIENAGISDADAVKMRNYKIVALCTGIGKDFIKTIMSMKDNYIAMMNAIQAQSKYCQKIHNIQLESEYVYSNKILIGEGRDGSKYYVAQSSDPATMYGLILPSER